MTTGRRTNNPDTKQRILLEAQKLFATNGYDGTTIRAIATHAGVNPALVIYFFKDKQQLFTSAILPIYEPMQKLPEIFMGDAAKIPERLATFVAALLSDPQGTNMAVGLVRSAIVNEHAAKILKETFFNETYACLKQNPDINDPGSYANRVTSQFIGLVVARHILKLEPFASYSRAELEEQIRHLFYLP